MYIYLIIKLLHLLPFRNLWFVKKQIKEITLTKVMLIQRCRLDWKKDHLLLIKDTII